MGTVIIKCLLAAGCVAVVVSFGVFICTSPVTKKKKALGLALYVCGVVLACVLCKNNLEQIRREITEDFRRSNNNSEYRIIGGK